MKTSYCKIIPLLALLFPTVVYASNPVSIQGGPVYYVLGVTAMGISIVAAMVVIHVLKRDKPIRKALYIPALAVYFFTFVFFLSLMLGSLVTLVVIMLAPAIYMMLFAWMTLAFCIEKYA